MSFLPMVSTVSVKNFTFKITAMLWNGWPPTNKNKWKKIIGVPLYIMSHFLLLLSIFFWVWLQHFDYSISVCRNFYVNHTWNFLSVLAHRLFSIKFDKILAIMPSIIFLSLSLSPLFLILTFCTCWYI